MTLRNPVRAQDVLAQEGTSYPEPFGTRIGKGNWRALGDPFDLTQFGVNLETLQPGAQSALRHWHTLSDEFVLVVEGELVLRTDDGESLLKQGMCMGFKAGDQNAHHLVNRSALAVSFLVVGSRVPGDTAFYPDDDLVWFRTESGRIAAHKDGSPYPQAQSGV